MGLLLHNWEDIVALWMASLEIAENDAVQPLLE